MLTSISISNFKAIQDADGMLKPLELEGLGRINYLVGKNGSGKSAVLEGIRVVSNSDTGAIPLALGDNRKLINVNNNKTKIKLHFDGNGHSLPNGVNDYVSEFGTVTANGLVISNNLSNLFLDRTSYRVSYFHLAELYNSKYLSKPFDFSFDDIDENVIDSLKSFLTSNFYTNDPVERIYKSTSSQPVIQYETKSGKIVNFKSMANGEKSLVRLFVFLVQIILNENIALMMIEEPEFGLHPAYQKLVPRLFDELINDERIKDKDTQFLITTHSPFIVSESVALQEQKVYLIDQAQTIDLANRKGRGKMGFSDGRSLGVVSKMLGAGLEDLSNVVQLQDNLPKYNVIYCEGKDSKLYSKIFPEDKDGRINVFIGVGGALDARNNYFIGKDTCKLSFGIDVNVSFLIDCSCSAGDGIDIGEAQPLKTDNNHIKFTMEERDKFLRYYSESGFEPRMLKRKEIENYLFDPEILEIALENNIITEQKYDDSTTLDFENGEVKNFVKSNEELNIKLAELITKDTSIYEELYNTIFVAYSHIIF